MSGTIPPNSSASRTSQGGPDRDRLLDLLADHALVGLSAQERAEMDALLRAFPELSDGSMDAAAALADLAMSGGRGEALPAGLRARLLAEGERAVGQGRGSIPFQDSAMRSDRRDTLRLAGWFAAAAALAVAAIGWWRPQTTPTVPGPIAQKSAAVERQELLASATDAQTITLGAWDNPEQPGVTGDVVWSESAQAGYLRLAGLKQNDPTVEQYQLWIVDSRGMDQRISGALFDAKPDPATGEVVVKIEPRIATRGAAAFALTIEKPGGVWVSDMTRRVVIGAKG